MFIQPFPTTNLSTLPWQMIPLMGVNNVTPPMGHGVISSRHRGVWGAWLAYSWMVPSSKTAPLIQSPGPEPLEPSGLAVSNRPRHSCWGDLLMDLLITNQWCQHNLDYFNLGEGCRWRILLA